MSAKRNICIAVWCLWSFFGLRAGIEPVNTRLTGNSLLSGQYINVTDNKFPSINVSGSYTTVSSYAKLVLGIDERVLTYTQPHSTAIDVNISWKNALGVMNTVNNVILTCNYDPSKSLNTFTYQNTYVTNGAHQLLVYINKIYDPANPSVPLSTVPVNIFLEAEQVSERYYQFDPNFCFTNRNGSATIVKHNTSFVSTSNELEISWMQIPGAEEYDLEWTYVNDYATTLGTYATSSMQFAFRNNATRIRTHDLKYKLSLNYEHGHILYRIRGIGRQVNGTQTANIEGDWSAPDLQTSPLTRDLSTMIGNPTFFGSAINYYCAISPLDDKKNAVYSSVFAEEGKKSESVGFFDGTLRNRQTVTKSNTEGQVIVGETFYDHQGRPAVTALPAPAYNSSGQPEATLKYYEDFNLSDQLLYPSTSQPAQFSREDFDLDLPGGSCPVPSYGMKTSSGASRYYSSNNPDKEGAQAYLPDAEKYPFKQTAYTPDNTGRVRKESGVGDDFKIGSGHETVSLSEIPLQTDLDILFGSEVGYNDRYKKNSLIDPNGQISISYINKDGKVVATALAGNSPSNLNSIAPSPVIKTNKYMSYTDENYSSINDFDGSTLVFSQAITADVTGIYTFTYNLQVPTFKDACMPGSMCYDCDYTLELIIRDECGGVLYPSTPNKIAVNGTIDYVCGAGITFNSSAPDLQFQATLTSGKQYYLEKRLTINPNSMEQYLSDYIAHSPCLKTKADFINDAIANVFDGSCNTSCATCAANVAAFVANHSNPYATDPNYFYISPAEVQALYDKCNEACKPISKCETQFKLMLGDVSPSGQYAKYNVGTTEYDASMHMLSIFNINNQLPQGQVNATAPPVAFISYLISVIFQYQFPSHIAQFTSCYASLPASSYAYWRNPRFYSLKQKAFITGANAYHYCDDADGTILSTILVKQVSPGVYSPAVLSSAVIKVNSNNQEYVYPEELYYLKDFITRFKSTWSYSLVKNHPEWCYFEWCKDQTVPANASPFSSSEGFDNLLRSVDTWSDAITSATVAYTGFNSTASNNVITDLLNADPYFANSAQGMNSVGGQPSGYLKNLLEYRLTHFLVDPTNSSVYRNAKEVANFITRYSTLYYSSFYNTPSSAPCTYGDPNTWPSSATYNVAQKTEVMNREWRLYRDFYLATKAEVQAIGAHMNAINKSSHSHCGCYNGCIGDPYFDGFNLPGNGELDGFAKYLPLFYQSGSYSMYGLFPYGGYYQNSQPCNSDKKSFYADKQKRFIYSTDLMTSMGVSGNNISSAGSSLLQNAQYEVYQQTGQCPMATGLQFFLNDMVKTGVFGSSINNVDLYFHPAFTKEIYDFANNFVTTGYTNYYFVKNSSPPANSIQFDFMASSPTSGVSNCNIILTASSPILWSRIVSLNGIKYTGNTSFLIYAYIDADSDPKTPAVQELLSGSTCISSTCSFPTTVCKANRTGKDLVPLFNYIFNNINTNNANLSTLYGSTYNLANAAFAPEAGFLTPAVTNALQIWSGALYLTNLSVANHQISFRLDNGTQQFDFQFDDPGSLLASPMKNLTYFSNLTPDPGDPCTFYLTANYVTTSSSSQSPPVQVAVTNTFQIVVTMSNATCIQVGDCSDPVPMHCNNPSYNTLLDLKKFLNELKTNYPNGLPASVNVTGYNSLTDVMRGQISSAGNIYVHSFISGSPGTGYIQLVLGPASTPGAGDCKIKLNIPTNTSWISISSFDKLTADLTQNGAFSAVMSYNGNLVTTITGTSCFNLSNCDDCSTTGTTIFTEDFDRFNGSTLPNVVAGSDWGVSNLTATTWKVTEQYYGFCSQVAAPPNNFGGFLPSPPYPVGSPDVYHMTVFKSKYDAICSSNPPTAQFNATQHTPSNLSTAASPENQPANQDMLHLFIDYTNIGSNPVLPAVIYSKTLPMTVQPGKKYRVSFWYNIDARIPMTAKIKVNGMTVNAIPMTWTGGPMAWKKMQGIYVNGTSSQLSFQITLENPSSSVGSGVILFDDITVEALDCDVPVTGPVVEADVTDECADQLMDVATHNAETKYNYYIDSVSTYFRDNYKSRCAATQETMYGKSTDLTHHYTLYYYDQAGNLVKTVPPEGVVPDVNLSAHQTAIDADRAFGTQTFFTDHKLASRYEYNSLNQLVKQNTPDQEGITSFETNALTGTSGLPTNITVNDIDFYPGGNQGILVAKNTSNAGEIYTTSDGGLTWTLNNLSGSGDITKMQHLGNNIVVAVTSSGNFLKSTDNGVTWTSYAVTNGTGLNALAFFQGQTSGQYFGLVGGNNGKIFFCNMSTSNPVFSSVGVPNNVSFDVKTIRSVSTGYWGSGAVVFVIGGTNGVLLHSYDTQFMSANGYLYYTLPPVLHLASTSINSNITINDMRVMLDANYYVSGFFVGKDANTGNGFASFINCGLNSTTNNSISNVLFNSTPQELTAVATKPLGSLNGYNVNAIIKDDEVHFGGINGAVYYLTYNSTVNLFTAYANTGIPSAASVNALEYADFTTQNSSTPDFYAACSNGILYKATSNTGGLSAVTTAQSTALKSMCIPQTYSSSNPLFIGGSGGALFKGTPNTNPITLTNVMQVTLPNVKGISIAKDNSGVAFAVGDNGLIFKRNSGIGGWQQLASGTSNNFTSVYALTPNNVIITSSGGNTYKYNGTSVSGVSGSPFSGLPDLNKVWFKDASNGYIVGNGGNLYTTTNGGSSFSSGSTGTANHLKDIHLFGNTGLIVGNNATILKLNGTSWNAPTGSVPSSLGNLKRVYMLDNNKAYAFSDNGKVIFSTNGGNDWTLLTTVSGANFNAVAFSGNAAQIIAAGSGSGNNTQLMKNVAGDYSTRFFYDRLGRLIISQNAKQYNKTTKAYSYTIYDALGRISQVGEIANTTDPKTLANYNAVIDPASYAIWLTGGTKTEVTSTQYDNSAGISGFTQDYLRTRVSASYIDNDDNLSNGFIHASYYSYDVHGNVKSILQNDYALFTAYGTSGYRTIDYVYDLISGKVNEVIYQKGKADEMRHKYEYDADNRIVNVFTSNNGGVTWLQDAKHYYYKHGPLARTELGPNKTQGIDYAYTLQGWVKGVNSIILDGNKDIGKDAVAGTGYITAQTDLHKFVGNDAFAYNLNYYGTNANLDYKAVDQAKYSFGTGTTFDASTNSVAFMSGTANNALYNGNISAMQTSIVKVGSGSNQNIYTPQPQLTTYKYDQLNRINEMRSYYDYTGGNSVLSTNSFAGFAAVQSNSYRNEFTYDANGNILNQKRYSDGAMTAMLLDNLTYQYDIVNGKKRSNKLYHVNDAGTNAAGDINDQGTFVTGNLINSSNNYSYDEIGNLVKDKAEEINNVTWNVYGKIAKIERLSTSTKPDLEFIYDASGNRATKIVKAKSAPGVLVSASSFVYTHYVRDSQGNIMATYERVSGTSSFKLMELNKYGSSRLGLLNVNSQLSALPTVYSKSSSIGTACYSRWLAGSQNYEMTNHLGNVLTASSDRKLPVDVGSNGSIDYFVADVLSTNDYYPFGALMPGRQYNSGNYKYGFNGKENDNEIKGTGNQQDYGMRIYDTRTGRFLSVDPLAKSYPMLTPYQFASNSPIANVDLDGEEALWFMLESLERIYGTTHLQKIREGATERGISSLASMANIPEAYKLLSDRMNKTFGGANGNKLCVTGDCGHFVEEMKVNSAIVESIVDNIVKDYGDLINKVVEGDERALGALAFEVGMFFFGEVEGIKGAGVIGQCKEYATDFVKTFGPAIESFGGKATMMEIKAGTDFGIAYKGKIVTKNGTHVFVEVVRDGERYIFDNVGKGVKHDEYFKNLEVIRKDGVPVSGDDAYKVAEKVEPTE